MAFYQYDPKKVSVSVGGVPVRGFADGDMVTVEFTSDKRSIHVGTDGNARHIRSVDETGTCTIRLASYSPSNAALFTLDKADEPYPIAVTDKSSNADLFFAESCALRKIPNMVKGAEETPLEWIYQFTRGEIVHSGAEI